MKKTFPLHVAGLDDARVRDKIRQELNRYVRRSRSKTPPEGFDRWELACRIGSGPQQADTRRWEDMGAAIDAVAAAGAAGVYVEIIASPAVRRFPT